MNEFLNYIEANWKIFLISCFAQFIITVIVGLGIRTPGVLEIFRLPQISMSNLISPAGSKVSALDIAEPKLEQKVNNFKLTSIKTSIFNAEVLASGDYDKLQSYVVIDYDSGKVLMEKNSAKQVPIASLTKLMTAVVSLDLASPDEVFTVSKVAENEIPTKIGVVEGQKMTLHELLQASLMTSANDASEVIKEGIDQKYGQEFFVQLMNKKAQFLGLKNTNFENPQGFDSGSNFSSASDLAVLSHYALENYPEIRSAAGKQYELLAKNDDHKQFDLYNWNGLLGVYPGTFGVKIGNTDLAQNTNIVVSERAGKRVLVVTLGAPGILERDLWGAELLDTGFQKLGVAAVNVTESQLRAKYATWKYWS